MLLRCKIAAFSRNACHYSLMQMFFGSVKNLRASNPPSRPTPLCFHATKRCTHHEATSNSPKWIPACNSAAILWAVFRSEVHIVAATVGGSVGQGQCFLFCIKWSQGDHWTEYFFLVGAAARGKIFENSRCDEVSFFTATFELYSIPSGEQCTALFFGSLDVAQYFPHVLFTTAPIRASLVSGSATVRPFTRSKKAALNLS